MWQIRKGVISSIPKYLHAGSILSELPISVFDSDIDNDKKLYARIRYEARIKGSKVIMIDHLGLIEVSDSSGQRYVDVGRITKTLHKMAKELKVCIVVLAQCGREAEGKKPNLALLRESGNIEQDGDVIMLLHRKREITDTEEKDPLAELPTDVIIAKNRDGRTGTATFAFQPTTMRFREDVGRSVLDDLGERNDSVKKKEYKDEIPF
jgi:replicative DNA helicase